VAELHWRFTKWQAGLQRMKNGADMIRCGVFLQQLIKKMHRMHHFVMLFVDMPLRKAE
jgi:hypothetical protein